ncbi:unnamed protein product [Parascedosporium putredinis]|uniref:Flavin-containing monooxygenase n=1 Tax=Parascedosporium putredinis TaxID=1442378 RepID=A0A9P1GYX1_9PEZI|nr:unnamed protein product [Parascedosporium putredinis]CAI7992246.1 unnamed protein product [Parascedosporium putredinis]
MAAKVAPTIAVVGLGALGLVTVKNLLEEGFDVTGFDSNEYVGGLWHYVAKDSTSVLKSKRRLHFIATVINVSAERGCFTDFPFPPDSEPFVPASVVEEYLENYADNFNLRPHLRLGTPIRRVARAEHGDKWAVTLDKTGEVVYFDKVVMATGIGQRPLIPEFPGVEKFTGQTLHSQGFKNGEDFKGRKVLVIGISNSGADTVVALQGHADKIYASHRDGVVVMPRFNKGVPIDHTITVRMDKIMGVMDKHFPDKTLAMIDKVLVKIMTNNFTIRPEWKLLPAPSMKTTIAVISDHFIDALEAGTVQSVGGVKQFTGPNEVELVDGTLLDVDTVIYCTGYRNDFGLYDLASMALAQVWAGASAAPLPSRKEMIRVTDAAYDAACDEAERSLKVRHPGWVNGYEFMAWASDAAGTGVNEKLGWGPRGLAFWLANPGLCGLLMGGIYSPHMFRLFETGKRKAWEGAEEEIRRVNAKVARATKERKAALALNSK